MAAEGLVFAGLNLNALGTTGPRLELAEPPSFPAPPKRLNWVSGADTDGAVLVKDERNYDNRQAVIKVKALGCTTREQAWDQFGQIADRLRRAEITDGGLPLIWTPSGGTRSFTMYVLDGEHDELPLDAPYFLANSPTFRFKVVCRPFGYATERAISAQTSSAPWVHLSIPAVAGDIPAECRLIVTDAAGQARRTVEWGAEQRHHNAGSPVSPLIDTSSLVTTGFAGAAATRTGARTAAGAASTSVVRGTLIEQPSAVCGTGNQLHVGDFRVKARIYATSANVRCRLAYRVGDGPYAANRYVTPVVANAWCEVDLGVVRLRAVELGSQRWDGRIEAYSATVGDTIDVDDLLLVPVEEGYGKARGEFIYRAGAILRRDDFTGTTAGNALNGRTSSFGAATWATSGATTDFSFVDSTSSGSREAVTRSATTGARYAVFGAAMTDTEVTTSVDLNVTGIGLEQGVCARYTSGVGGFIAALVTTNPVTVNKLVIKDVAGTVLASTEVQFGLYPWEPWHQVTLIVYASGRLVAMFRHDSQTLATITAWDARAATGGTLASGAAGIYHSASTTAPGYYDNPVVSIPSPEPLALSASQSLEVRPTGDEKALREDAAGTVWGRVPRYRGGRCFVPPATDSNLTTRILVKAHRNDVDVAADDAIGDALTVEARITERFLTFPRS
ncbi:MAG TPA: hypothetical protein VFZ00_01465 [Solirubrobacter sp.]|nr:hypothetical protein [Solirubrobacter sp.]